MSSSTSHSEDNGRVEKGPTGELKKTIPNKTSATEESTSRKDDEKTTFRGPDGGAKLFTKDELKKLQIHIEIKKPKAASTPPAVPFDPNLIAPVRRPGEGRAPLFSRLPTVNEDEDNAKKEKLDIEKKKEKSEHRKSHSRSKSRSRSPRSSSRRSSRRYKNYISEREDFIRKLPEADGPLKIGGEKKHTCVKGKSTEGIMNVHTADIEVAQDRDLLLVGVPVTTREEAGALVAAAQNLEHLINRVEVVVDAGVGAGVGAEAGLETTEGGTGVVSGMILDITGLGRVVYQEWLPTQVLRGATARLSATRTCLGRPSHFILRL